jgi:hypothetical protein
MVEACPRPKSQYGVITLLLVSIAILGAMVISLLVRPPLVP